MLVRLKRLFGQLTGASERELIELLLDQLDATVQGAQLARAAVGSHPTAQARDEMGDIERAGDSSRAALVEALARSLVTPVDREDLFRLSRSVDDVLDNLRDFVRELHLLQVGSDDLYVPVIEAVISGVEALREAVAAITHAPGTASTASLAAKKSCNTIRRLYQSSVARLLNETELDHDLLKRRELLRRLDVVGLRLGEAADALADGVLKRGY